MKKNVQYATDKFSVIPTSLKRDNNGFLRGDAYLTRTGVFPYINPDGSVRYELRHPDDVFAPDSIETMKMVPITKEHPYEPLDSDNASYNQVGHLGDSIRKADDGIRLIGPVLITDEDMIQEVENKERTEISMGYMRLIVEESGTYNGIPYTHRQKNMVYNHAAITKKGRAGSSVKLVTDSAINQDDFPDLNVNNENLLKDKQMETVTINGIVYDSLTKEVVQEVARLTQLATDNANDLEKANTALGTATAKAQTAQDSLDAELAKDHSEGTATTVKARVGLIASVSPFIAEDARPTLLDMDDNEIKETLIQTRQEGFAIDSLDGDDAFKAGYLSHAFDSALKAHRDEAKLAADSAQRTPFKPSEDPNPANDSQEMTARQAQDSMNERIYNKKSE